MTFVLQFMTTRYTAEFVWVLLTTSSVTTVMSRFSAVKRTLLTDIIMVQNQKSSDTQNLLIMSKFL